MSDFTVGSLTDCLTHDEQNHPFSVAGVDVTVTDGAIAAYIYLLHALIENADHDGTAFFSIQTKGEAAATDESWVEVFRVSPGGGTPILCTIDTTEAIGQTTLGTVNGEGTNLTNGEQVYIQDAGGATDGEWHWILDKAPDADSVVIAEGLVNAKANADEIYSLAESWMYILPLAGVTEWRVVYNNRGASGDNTAFWGRYKEVTDFA